MPLFMVCYIKDAKLSFVSDKSNFFALNKVLFCAVRGTERVKKTSRIQMYSARWNRDKYFNIT